MKTPSPETLELKRKELELKQARLEQNEKRAQERKEDAERKRNEKEKKRKKDEEKTALAELSGVPIGIEPIYATTVQDKPFIVEQVFDKDTKKIEYIIYDSQNDKWTRANIYTTTKGVYYAPLDTKAVREEEIIFASYPQEYGSNESLRQDITNFTRKWLGVDEEHRTWAVYAIMKSWLFERFHTLNYLRALGDTGLGKSRYLDTFGYLHYKPLFTTSTVTSAALFRVMGLYRGTVIIDEADRKDSGETDDVTTVINQGFEKGRPVLRCDPDNPREIDFIDVYGPKLLASRKEFGDKATESRCITFVMGPVEGKYPSNLNDKFHAEVATLQNKLLLYRLRNFYSINPDAGDAVDLGDLEPRILQTARPFVALFSEDKEQLGQFKIFLAKQQREIIEERMNTWEGRIAKAVYDLLPTSEDQVVVTPQDIVDKADLRGKDGNRVQPRAISRYCKELKFGNAVLRRTETGVKRVYEIPRAIVESVAKRYGCNVVTVVTDVTQPSQNIPIKQKKQGGNTFSNLETSKEGVSVTSVTNVTTLRSHILSETGNGVSALSDLLHLPRTGAVARTALNLKGFSDDTIDLAIQKGEVVEDFSRPGWVRGARAW